MLAYSACLSPAVWSQPSVSVPAQMLSFMHAQYSLFQQGYNLLDEIDPYMKKLAAEVSETMASSSLFCSHTLSSPDSVSCLEIGVGLIWNIDVGRLCCFFFYCVFMDVAALYWNTCTGFLPPLDEEGTFYPLTCMIMCDTEVRKDFKLPLTSHWVCV